MQQDTSDTKSTDTKVTWQDLSQHIIRDIVQEGEEVSTSPESLTNTSEEVLKAEKELQEKFPIDCIHIKDIAIENLKVTPLITKFKFLDDMLFLKKDKPQIVIVGARPGQGKSAFMLQIAASVAERHNVGFFSLEMEEKELKTRLLAPRIKRSADDILKGNVSHSELISANEQFEKLNLNLWCNFKRNIMYIFQQAHDLNRRKKLDLIVIDYIQKCTGPTKQSKTYEVEEVLGQCKEMLGQIKCPILLGAQVNRNCEYRGKSTGDYKPIKADLKDSGSIEQDADVILFISRQEVYDGSRKGEADFIIAKNRSGKEGSKVMHYNGDYCEFYEGAITPRRRF